MLRWALNFASILMQFIIHFCILRMQNNIQIAKSSNSNKDMICQPFASNQLKFGI